ncbi:hypothetical protein MSG28_001848 [Choristoneura fumiferana]|uniref:Uncharacterized protein n=1 Tax=Choristoneura fumiferana TaxID=7141 RepID=A0ACC0KVN1_CHOFU|nr:hypothetical protein MSG28_001848 [Choristoneura fumiferana]
MAAVSGRAVQRRDEPGERRWAVSCHRHGRAGRGAALTGGAPGGELEALRRHSRQIAARRVRRVQVCARSRSRSSSTARPRSRPPAHKPPLLFQFTERTRDGARGADGAAKSVGGETLHVYHRASMLNISRAAHCTAESAGGRRARSSQASAGAAARPALTPSVLQRAAGRRCPAAAAAAREAQPARPTGDPPPAASRWATCSRRNPGRLTIKSRSHNVELVGAGAGHLHNEWQWAAGSVRAGRRRARDATLQQPSTLNK